MGMYMYSDKSFWHLPHSVKFSEQKTCMKIVTQSIVVSACVLLIIVHCIVRRRHVYRDGIGKALQLLHLSNAQLGNCEALQLESHCKLYMCVH